MLKLESLDKSYLVFPLIGASITSTVFSLLAINIIQIDLKPIFLIPPVSVGFIFGLIFAYIRQTNYKLSETIKDLNEALAKIKTLEGLITVCSRCKNISRSEGSWDTIERYIENNSQAKFTHSICPECQDIVKKDAIASLKGS